VTWINGWVADRFSPKIVMMTSSIFALTCFIFIFVYASSLGLLVAAEVYAGFEWLIFVRPHGTPAHTSESRFANLPGPTSKPGPQPMRPKFALSSFAATSPPTSISVGVAVSFYLQVWSGRPLPSPPTGVPGPTEGGPKIVIMVVGMRLLSGENLIDQGVQFLQVAHISTNLAFSLNMVLKSMFVTVPPSPGVYCTSVDALYTVE